MMTKTSYIDIPKAWEQFLLNILKTGTIFKTDYLCESYIEVCFSYFLEQRRQ